MRPHMRAMETALEQRGYPTKKERDAFRDGFTDGCTGAERETRHEYLNAYSAGYWEGYPWRQGALA